MRNPVVRLYQDKLIVDSFAGGGGASCGMEMALGRSPDIAINHDAEAIEMHKANHPSTMHYNEDVWRVDPATVCKGRKVGLMWLSPDCKHFSKAKGKAPVEKRIRGLAWVAVKWARLPNGQKPDVIILENVEEFAGWGPVLEDGTPCPVRKGRTFKRFVRALRNEGYEVDWRELRADYFGTPTSRNRLFLIARCDGLPIEWPEPTHGRGLLPVRTAAECIDWSIPTHSIFLTNAQGKAVGVKRPLAENTMRRIARGIQKFVIDSPTPFIVPMQHNNTPASLTDPLDTITTQGNKFNLVTPFIAKFRFDSAGSPIDKPLPTITAGPKENPAGAAHAMAVVSPCIARIGQTGGRGDYSNSIERPLTTVTSKAEHLLVAPVMVPRYGERDGQAPRALTVERPMPTIVPTQNGGQLVMAFMAQHNTDNVGHSVDGEPVSTIVGKGCTQGLVTSNIVKLKGTCKDGQPVDTPLHTVQASGGHYAEVRAFLIKFYSTGGQWGSPSAPLATLPTKDRIGLVTVRGEDYVIVDIGMRMLSPRELFRAQGFPDTYIIDRTASGKPLTKDAQVRMCGNSVCPPLAKALVEANYGRYYLRRAA